MRREASKELYHYRHAMMLSTFILERLLVGLEIGAVYVDFDARSGHNHGTKFRVRPDPLPTLYEQNEQLF